MVLIVSCISSTIDAFILVNIYNPPGGKHNKENILTISKILDEFSNKTPLIIVGDLNIKLNCASEVITEHCNSEHFVIQNNSRESKAWISLFNKYHLTVLNGNTTGDCMKNVTRICGKSMRTLDYMFVNRYAQEIVCDMAVGCREESDHLPLYLLLK